MRKCSAFRLGFFNLRALIGVGLCAGAVLILGNFAMALPDLVANKDVRSNEYLLGRTRAGPSTINSPTPPGQWTMVDSPSVGGAGSQDFLFGLSCVTATDCWTVGYVLPPGASGSGGGATLIEHYNGAAWSPVDSPSFAGQPSYLQGVTCVSTDDCWAVGYYGSSVLQTLIQHYDGSEWTIVNSPNQPDAQGNPQGNQLFGVTCTSANDCWAVGAALIQPGPFIAAGTALVEHYDGATWSLVNTPSVNGAAPLLFSVTCTSSNNCWAAGYTLTGLASQTLIEHYDGSVWSIASSANSANEQNFLSAVTCFNASECWAVGESYTQDVQIYQTLIERFDGSSWSIVGSPNASNQTNSLEAVTCARENDCWAVGFYLDDVGTTYLTLTEHYDGNGWSVVATPNVSGRGTNDLQAIQCLGAGNCWAIGYSFDYPTYTQFTEIEHYEIPVALNTVVSRKTHGGAGTFDINLPLSGSPGIECRSGGTSGEYTLVFTFSNTLAEVGGVNISSGSALLASGDIDAADAHNYIVNLSAVSNAETITVDLTNVSDSAGEFSSIVAGSMKVLIGDVNGSGVVDSGDLFVVRQQTGQTANASNFRQDVNASGVIDSGDVFLTRQQTGTSAP